MKLKFAYTELLHMAYLERNKSNSSKGFFVTLHAPIPHSILFISILPLFYCCSPPRRTPGVATSLGKKTQREFLLFHFLWTISHLRGIYFHHSRLHNFIISRCNKHFPIWEKTLLLKCILGCYGVCVDIYRNHTIIPVWMNYTFWSWLVPEENSVCGTN